MDLRTYLDAEKRSHSEFAASIGVSATALYRYLAGERFPKQDVLTRIVEQTNGSVQPNDLFRPRRAPASAQDAA